MGKWLLAAGAGLFLVTRAGEACALDSIGGAHVAYAIGGSAAQANGGLRHGLDFALMAPLFGGDNESSGNLFYSSSGYTFGPSGIIGFGKTPHYLALDFGYGASSVLGGFLGAGPVYRLGSATMNRGVGIEGRFSMDLLFVNGGLRLMLLHGDNSSEVALTVSLGVGRF